MRPTDADLLKRIDQYVEQLFAPADDALAAGLRAADAAGLPPISVSATEGKLLYLIARIAGARRILEIGTLAGYSTTWLARAVDAGGTVVTLEIDPKHAEVARSNLRRAAPHVHVDVRVGDATAALNAMIAAGEPAFDLVFIDADKPRYAAYLELALQLSRAGTVILADNVIRHGSVMDEGTADANARGAQEFNRALAAHPRLDSLILPILREKVDGLSISIVGE